MSQAISQREARRLRKRVAALESAEEDRRNGWRDNYPGGVLIASVGFSDLPRELSAIVTARLLKHAVVVTTNDKVVNFRALPVAQKPTEP